MPLKSARIEKDNIRFASKNEFYKIKMSNTSEMDSNLE